MKRDFRLPCIICYSPPLDGCGRTYFGFFCVISPWQAWSSNLLVPPWPLALGLQGPLGKFHLSVLSLSSISNSLYLSDKASVLRLATREICARFQRQKWSPHALKVSVSCEVLGQLMRTDADLLPNLGVGQRPRLELFQQLQDLLQFLWVLGQMRVWHLGPWEHVHYWHCRCQETDAQASLSPWDPVGLCGFRFVPVHLHFMSSFPDWL